MDKEDYLKENIEEVPVFQSIEKQKYIFLEQAQPEDEIEYEIVADVKKMQELVKPIMPKMPVKANRVVVAPEPMRVFAKRYSETRRVVAETVKEFPKLHIDYDAGTMTFNGENIDLNPNHKEYQEHPEILLRHGLFLRRCRTGQKGLLQVHDLVSGYTVYGIFAVFCIKEQLRYETVPIVRRDVW